MIQNRAGDGFGVHIFKKKVWDKENIRIFAPDRTNNN